MPPYFLYIMALAAYIAIAGCVLIIAALLAVPKQTRSFAKRLAAGICGSFPGVFLFQILAVPAVVLTLLLMFLTFAVFHPATNWQGVVIICFAFLMFGIVALASVAGFYTGFRIAWEYAAGRSVRQFLNTDRLLGPFVRFLRRRVPFASRRLPL